MRITRIYRHYNALLVCEVWELNIQRIYGHYGHYNALLVTTSAATAASPTTPGVDIATLRGPAVVGASAFPLASYTETAHNHRKFEYHGEFLNKIEIAWNLFLWPNQAWFMQRNLCRKSHAWAPLKGLSHQIFKAFLSPTILNLYFLGGRWWFLNFFIHWLFYHFETKF